MDLGRNKPIVQQLTTFPKTKPVSEVAAALRNWRRHFGRALEVEAVLPDGVLLLKALDGPIQQLGALAPQAAFRLAQSRMQLGLDERPTQDALRSYSQCLLAEAETLCLVESTPDGPTTPLKLKQLDGSTPSPTKPGSESKPKTESLADKPCRYFISDSGCRAGKACKWMHAWDNVPDKASRCWLCGAKDHRKQDCPVRGGNKTKPGEPVGSGGGNGRGRGGSSSKSHATSDSSVGGKAGAAAIKPSVK